MVAVVMGCATRERVIPEPLEAQVDRTVTFDQLRESPDSYRGRLVALGGEVLKAKRLKDGTQLEVLQLPLADWQPSSPRNESQGRFLAIQKEFLDPATLGNDTRVTIVGEVIGATTQHLDEMEYRYPTIEVKHLKVWEPRPAYQRPAGPRWSVYGGGGTYGGYGGVGVGIGF
jgi:outer membrane lipoprotein